MSELSYSEFLDAIITAAIRRLPFSMIRLGDGEGIVLGYPSRTSEKKCRERLNKWFDGSRLTVADLNRISAEMKQACLSADLIGLPQARHNSMDGNWRNVRKYVKEFRLMQNARPCSMDFVLDLQLRDDFRKVFIGQKELYCISCRKLDLELSASFGIPKVETFCLPPQRRPRMGVDHAKGQLHYPELYALIPRWLKERNIAGKFVLVGAGGLGKIYCSWVKQQGGIAIDIGSIFDGWAQLGTRSHLRNSMSRYALRRSHPRVER